MDIILLGLCGAGAFCIIALCVLLLYIRHRLSCIAKVLKKMSEILEVKDET